MEAERLAQLGLTVQEGAAGPEVVLPLHRSVVNPLTRRPVPAVTLALAEELLIPVDPPELVGLPPLAMDAVTEAPELEARLLADFDEHVARLEGMASQLEALGLQPCVDPGSLEVRAETQVGGLRVLLGADKQGKIRIREVHRAGAMLRSEVGAPFALSQFADAPALQAHLLALVVEAAAPGSGIGYGELAERFGPVARVPPTSALELVSDFTVRGERYRFVAARVRGRTFRGLLAGPDGKKWAEHFQLEDFPGVADVAARALGVSPGEISWLEGDEP
ncbi:MAG: hypothetical protein EHM78_10135 [Myxococcaceae bacterium]|nr:MAG: hypothetical protein EHM78_10135 [Myxococcaceae bacterium]